MAFPNWNRPWLAWVALVPWLAALQSIDGRASSKTPRHLLTTPEWRAFAWSYLIGAFFFLGSLYWLIHVTVVGWIILSLYIAVYFGLFGWIAWRVMRQTGRRRARSARARGSWLARLVPLAVVPSAWVACEYLRSHVFSGFGWNLLGYSQTGLLPVIQIADLLGVWGVSWLVVAVNTAVTLLITARSPRERAPVAIAAALLVAAAVGYGVYELRVEVRSSPIRAAVIQGNIPQEEKWDEEHQPMILEKYSRLTREAAAQPVDVIIWPETSVPGFLGIDEAVTVPIFELARSVPVPLLVSAPMAKPSDGPWRMTNSAVLFDGDQGIVERYDKLHLVPFGEFIPGESVMPWLRDALPPIGDFVPGRAYTVFTLPGSAARFSVLVCFEDVFPDLARRFVLNGARMLATITNDAWFGKTAAAYQHAQASTLRAVELRVPMLRAANTGWSGCIDATGRWLTSVRDARGEELFVDGIAACEVAPGASLTRYARWGDWWPAVCFAVVAGWLAQSIARRPRRAAASLRSRV